MIYYIMGKSATGKDTVYRKIREDFPEIRPVILYTTRPMREGEEEGREYYFIKPEILNTLDREGVVIERRAYNTVNGIWEYATVDDGTINADDDAAYLAIGTLEAYTKMKAYYGEEMLKPIYLYASDGTRIRRAIKREGEQERPDYKEMCRRFLADYEDFSNENLIKAGIEDGYEIEVFEDCYAKICETLRAGR